MNDSVIQPLTDEQFASLELKLVCPNVDSWSEDYLHMKMIKAAGNELIAFLADANKKIDAIEANDDLTTEAKRTRVTKLASDLVAQFDALPTHQKVKEIAEQALKNYQTKIEAPLKLQEDYRQIAVHVQIRDRLHAMKDEAEQLRFLEKHGSDPAVLRAVLTAPAWLSGLSDTAYAYVRAQLEKQAPPEVIALRDQTKQMLAEVERGQRAVRARLSKRGGLDKPTASAAPAAENNPGPTVPRWPSKPKHVQAPKSGPVWAE